jgi:DegV family protein with EDD domain
MGDSNTCIIVDSACDLSADFIQANQIEVLPIAVRFGNQTFVDTRNEADTVALYKQEFDKRGIDAETAAYSIEQITDTIANHIAPNYDNALILTISSSRSPLFQNARKSIFLNLNRFKEAREGTGRDAYFSVRVLDTETLFTGEAIIAHEAVRLIREQQLPLNKLSTPLEQLSRKVYAYVIPRDLYFIHKRGKKKGDKSVGWLSYKIGNMLDVKPIIQAHRGETEPVMKASGFDAALKKLLEHAMQQIKRGLATKLVAISYAGDLQELNKFPVIDQFIKFAEQNGVEVMVSVMSTTAAVNIGTGSFSLAFAAA